MWACTAAYALLLLVLVARAPVRTIGDGPEYIIYGVAFARGLAPGLHPDAIREIGRELAVDPSLAAQPTDDWTFARRDGRREFIHFWLYSMLAAPFVAGARAVPVDPRYGFALFNFALLIVTFAMVCKRLGATPAFLLAAGPIVWWADKAHPEVLLFSLTSLALLWWRDRPWLALGAAGVAAAQVPPFAAMVPLIAAASLMDRPQRWRQPSFVIAVAAALSLAAWPVVHYLRHYGRSTLLAGGGLGSWQWPSSAELSAPLFDLNVGLVPHHPFLALAVSAAGVMVAVAGWRRLLRPDIAVAIVFGIILLFAFPQIRNWTHGGTPGISRFAVWLTPLAIPLLAAAADVTNWRRLAPWFAVASIIWTVAHFAPERAEVYPRQRRPTWIARQVWLHAPGWSQPLPVVFASVLKPDRTTLPVAADGCRKLLLVGRGDAQGMWPRPCPPAPVPTDCRSPGTLCWANRSQDAYHFKRVRGPALPFAYDPESVWPLAAEPGVLSAIDRVDWWSLRHVDALKSSEMIGYVAGAQIEFLYEADEQAFLSLTGVQPGASIVFTAPAGSSALVMDGRTGRTLSVATNDAPAAAPWTLQLTPGPNIIIVLTPPRIP